MIGEGLAPCVKEYNYMNYLVRAQVNQIVTKEVQLTIRAGSEEEAMGKARAALHEYPDKVTVSGILRIVTEKARYWIPRDIEFTETREEEDIGGD